MVLSRFAISIVCVGLATTANGAAPAAPPSPELKAAIAVAKLYGPTADLATSGNKAFINVITVPGRTQDIFFSGRLQGPTGAQTRLIYAVAANFKEPIKPALAVRLLQENLTGLPFGAWSLGRTPNGTPVIIYSVEVSANAPASTIKEVVTTIAARADALDLELTGKDSQ